MKLTPLIGALILLAFLIGAFTYSSMPERMASHWNEKGEVDGYTSRFWGVFLMPAVMLFIGVLFLAIPIIDPLKKNIAKFRNYFDGFIVLFQVFFLYIYILTLLWNLGHRFNMTTLLLPALGLLFIYMGVLMQNAKRNWFIGIRTPWTLSSEKVWDKTHKLGAKLFKAAGVIALLGVFAGDYAIWLILVPVLLVTTFLIVYSYVEYQKK